jgi:hypothetical protein
MDPALRIVTRIPLTELWTERGPAAAVRERLLGRADVKALLQAGAVQFVVADGGQPLRWVPLEERFVFWKGSARDHIVEDPSRPIDIYAYPEGFAYIASEWASGDVASPPIVLLESHH